MQVNKCTYTPNSNFNGKLIIKKHVTYSMIDALNASSKIKELTKNNDLVIRSSMCWANMNDIYHSAGEALFKLKFSLLREDSLIDKIKDILHLVPRVNLTKGYHSLDGTINAIENDKKMNLLRDKLLKEKRGS